MKKSHFAESLILGGFLTIAGGFMDTYSYFVRDKVFANAQTGNIIFLAQAIIEGNALKILRYIFPISFFILGVYAANCIKRRYKDLQRIHYRRIIVLFESFVMLLVGFLPQEYNILANVMLNFACALQTVGFDAFGELNFATTMCVGNLRKATEFLSDYHHKGEPSVRNKALTIYLVICIFAVGAGIGGILSRLLGVHAIWFDSFLLFVLSFFIR
ncbi:YoaK family protein [Treponema phagedenis]|uniref:YoaK family protein n=1 Tax=Treponema phagedenis TaxID=162 RepID=UPI0001F63762|nr:YoaK family protein [Treponema phagedenis]EFW36951.1 hypothetical protein HMPREF9554_02571 [Treponema phagedenis F0421]TYT79080.1 DUF1275 domain-containing protein [Treponema phagedenis]